MYFNERSIFMNHFEVITASKTWTCPKTGIYKIIAVGGGSSGAIYATFSNITAKKVNSKVVCTAGGNTTFGSLLTAKGGNITAYSQIDYGNTSSTQQLFGGAGGYTLQNYGGIGGYMEIYHNVQPTINGGFPGYPGNGYGAGGTIGAKLKSFDNTIGENRYEFKLVPFGSMVGDLNELICDIAINTSYACAIGSGGTVTASALQSVVSAVDSSMVSNTNIAALISTAVNFSRAGKIGCIVIEYLGESY